MTRDEILAMDEGPELDALVAEKVMELAVYCNAKTGFHPYCATEDVFVSEDNEELGRLAPTPSYSTDIAAAWQAIEELWAERWTWFNLHPIHEGWQVEVEVGNLAIPVIANTAPLAICRAALLAVMEAEA